jgi:hypothetical protein
MGKFKMRSLAIMQSITIIGIVTLIVPCLIIAEPQELPKTGTRSNGSPINLWWISVNRTDNQQTSVLDGLTEPNANTLIKFAGNYSGGWQNAAVEIKAWYDHGQTGNSSKYPVESDSNRNSAFRIRYYPNNRTAWVIFPQGDMEIKIVTANDTISQANPSNPDQSIHTVELLVFFGNQVWNADGERFSSYDVAYDSNPGKALLDPRSWDLNITISDKNNPDISDSLYGEFGITGSVSVMMSGNPSAVVEPGDYVKMDVGTNIKLSSNSVYWVNVSTSNLLRDGVGPEFIPVTNVSVRNTHPLANASNSGISGEPVAFTGENQPLSVWGLDRAYMAPAGNGTCIAGPWMTDYNSDNLTTQLEWWISVPRGTQLGIYWAAIVVNIESSMGEPIIVTPKQFNMGGGVQVVDLTPPISKVIRADTHNVTAEAYDGETKIENVTLWYRFSKDNVTWGNWTEYETDQQAPWLWNDVSPEGEGYYEFYTVAMDSGENQEQPPLIADMSAHIDMDIPGFELPTIFSALAISMLALRIRNRKKK